MDYEKLFTKCGNCGLEKDFYFPEGELENNTVVQTFCRQNLAKRRIFPRIVSPSETNKNTSFVVSRPTRSGNDIQLLCIDGDCDNRRPIDK